MRQPAFGGRPAGRGRRGRAARAARAARPLPPRDSAPAHPPPPRFGPILTLSPPSPPQAIKDRVQGARQAISSPFLGALESFLVYFSALIDYCDAQLSDDAHVAALASFEPDVIVGDVVSPCALGLTGILWRKPGGARVPRVMFSSLPVLDPLLPGIIENVPNHLATVPQMGTGFPPGAMSLGQRAANVLHYLGSAVVHRLRVRPLYMGLGARHNISITTEFLHSSAMILYNADWAVEAPRHLPPNVRFVGAMTTKPAAPLGAEWDAALGDGAVFASLGTLVTVGLEEYRAVAAALSALPARVVWKLAPTDLPPGVTVADLGVGPRVTVTPWAPQNDLLGDPRVKAFVTHGGLNSVYEAAYHGVPIVGLPVYGDQPDNVAKAVAAGWGLAVHLPALTPASLAGAVRRVLAEPAFRAAAGTVARRMAQRLRDPAAEAADWVEHAAALGPDSAYMKTGDHRLSWMSYAMLDVAAVFAAVAVAAAFAGNLLRRAARAAVRAALAPPAKAAPEPLELADGKGAAPARGRRRSPRGLLLRDDDSARGRSARAGLRSDRVPRGGALESASSSSLS